MTDFTDSEKETVPFSEQEKEFARCLQNIHESIIPKSEDKIKYMKSHNIFCSFVNKVPDKHHVWGGIDTCKCGYVSMDYYIENQWLLLAREVRGREWQTIHCELGKIREKIKDLYHQIGKVKVWNASNDVVCDLCEEKVDEIINETQCELKSHFFTTSVLEVKEASVASEDDSKTKATLSNHSLVSDYKVDSDSASVPPKGVNIDFREKGMTGKNFKKVKQDD